MGPTSRVTKEKPERGSGHDLWVTVGGGRYFPSASELPCDCGSYPFYRCENSKSKLKRNEWRSLADITQTKLEFKAKFTKPRAPFLLYTRQLLGDPGLQRGRMSEGASPTPPSLPSHPESWAQTGSCGRISHQVVLLLNPTPIPVVQAMTSEVRTGADWNRDKRVLRLHSGCPDEGQRGCP